MSGEAARPRFLLGDPAGLVIVGVALVYLGLAGDARVVRFYEVALLGAAVAWLAGVRVESGSVRGALMGLAVGVVAAFNVLSLATIGMFLPPVTALLVVALVFTLRRRGGLPAAVAAAGAAALALAAELTFAFVVSPAVG
jgi:hypothetical protein